MAGLGAAELLAMTQALLALKGKISMLLVEHDMEAVFALADRISVLVYGRIVATGAPAEIQANAGGAHRLSGRGRRMMLSVQNLSAAYGHSRVLFGRRSRRGRRRMRDPARS